MSGWKTVILGVLIMLLSILSNTDMQAFFADNLPWVGSITGAAVIVLRALTKTAIFKSE